MRTIIYVLLAQVVIQEITCVQGDDRKSSSSFVATTNFSIGKLINFAKYPAKTSPITVLKFLPSEPSSGQKTQVIEIGPS